MSSGASHAKQEKPPKKNDLKIQMDNFAKMAAYMNKNTFSSVTTLPPEENRLYIGGNMPKNKQPLWVKDGDLTDTTQPLPVTENSERDQFSKELYMRLGSNDPESSRCRKCNPGRLVMTKAATSSTSA